MFMVVVVEHHGKSNTRRIVETCSDFFIMEKDGCSTFGLVEEGHVGDSR